MNDYMLLVWNKDNAYVYDLTLHQWATAEGIKPQSGMVEPNQAVVYTVDKVFFYDRFTHRWKATYR